MMKVFYKLNLLTAVILFMSQTAYAQPQPVDCILDAAASADITSFIENGIAETNHGWTCSDPTSVVLVIPTTATATLETAILPGDPSGPTGVAMGDCGSTANEPADVWYSFTPTTAVEAWVDLYRGATNPQNMVIELYETVTPLGGDCTGAITGEITYLGCSDQGNGDFAERERATCTGLIGERLDVSSLNIGTTYYLRIAQWTGDVPTADVDFLLCAEVATPIGPAVDDCSDFGSTALNAPIAANTGCGSATTTGADVNITYSNQSNAGAFGNDAAGMDGLISCPASDYNYNSSVAVAVPTSNIDPGCVGSSVIPLVGLNNVLNNNVMYAIEVDPCDVTNNVAVTLTFENVEVNQDGAMQVTAVGPVDAAAGGAVGACVAGAPVVANFSFNPITEGTSCVSFSNTGDFIDGVFIVMIEGQSGTLVKWDLTVEIDYLDPCADNVPACNQALNGGSVNGVNIPIGLAAFNGQAEGKGNRLEWITYTEQNNRHFEVERSTNGKDYTRLDYVNGNGTTTETKRYIYFDNAAPIEAYYRLKQVDFNGEYTYSDVVHISRKNDAVSINSVTPNPTINEANLSFNTNAAGTAMISVTDMFGKQISTKEVATIAGENNETLDLAGQAAGVYFVTINYGEYSVVKKIMKN